LIYVTAGVRRATEDGSNISINHGSVKNDVCTGQMTAVQDKVRASQEEINE
jgi:hypothetical protein